MLTIVDQLIQKLKQTTQKRQQFRHELSTNLESEQFSPKSDFLQRAFLTSIRILMNLRSLPVGTATFVHTLP